METLATYGWRKDPSVEEGLFSEGRRFDFYQAVKLLESLYPERDGVGNERHPERQAVRFRSRVALDFAVTDVHSIARPEAEGEPAMMAVNFLGLAGTQGPLPRRVTELILERRSRKDTAFADFLDLFNSRLVAMLFRARKKYRPALHWGPPEEARISRTFFGMIGLGTDGLEGRMGVRDRSLLNYAGILSRTARTLVGGERVLSHYFDVPVDIEPFAGAWLEIAEDETTRIGETGQNQILGRTTVVGRRFWDEQVGYEIRVGPVDFETFRDFLPTGTALEPLWALAGFYTGHELEFRVRLTLEKDEVPELELGAEGENAPLLGWTTWLRTQAADEDDSQVVLTAASRTAVAVRSDTAPNPDDSPSSVAPAPVAGVPGEAPTRNP